MLGDPCPDWLPEDVVTVTPDKAVSDWAEAGPFPDDIKLGTDRGGGF